MDILKGYEALWEKGIIHRDIKPENLFVTAADEVMIGDFGLSIEKESHETEGDKYVGSPFYMAPEIIDSDEESLLYTTKSDIWAIGMTFLEMIMGRRLLKSRSEEDLIKEVKEFDIEKAMPSGLNSKSKRLLRGSLCLNPELRKGLKELLKINKSVKS